MIFQNAKLIRADRIEAGRQVLVDGGRIAAISDRNEWSRDHHPMIDLAGSYLAPGFIDLHVHGARTRDTTEGDPAAFETICDYHASGGTTSLLLATVTASIEEILRVLRTMEKLKGVPFAHGAQILGLHVEGPYISKEKSGAHRRHLVRDPVPSETAALLEYASLIKVVTLAPELPGALELIDALRRHGIRVSGGHSDAWDEHARAALEHGMTQVTHTFNCMSTARRRGAYRVAGLLEFALSEPGIKCELIADGYHVSPTLLRMVYRAKGADGICLVTDTAGGAGLPEGAKFVVGEIDCVAGDGVGFTADGTKLAGGMNPMIRLVRNMVTLVGASLPEAVRMATLNPARALGIENRKGTLTAGADADLVVLSENLDVLQTYIGGRCVYRNDGDESRR